MIENMHIKKGKKSVNWKKTLFVYGGMAWPILHFFIFWFCVNIGTLVYSFFKTDLYGNLVFAGGDIYEEVFQYLFHGKTMGMVSLQSVLNTFSLIFLALFINTPITLLFSYMIYKKIKGHSVLRVTLYVPCVVSSVILCLFFRVMFSGTATYNSVFTLLEKLGYSNKYIIQNGVFASKETAWPFVLIFSIWTGITGNIIYFNSAMARLPDSVLESADLDGATQMRQFFSIMIPMIWPTLTTMGITLISGALNLFLPPSLMVGEDMAGPTGSGTIAWIITSQVRSGGTAGFPAAFGVVIAVVFGTLITLFKKGMEKVFVEVTY